jgi:CHAT domain-containing protein
MKAGRRPSAREEVEYRAIARELYDRIWAPLSLQNNPGVNRAVSADSAAMVLLVPVWWLHLLDFNTLLAPTGELVIEQYKLHYLSSAGDLVRLARRKPTGRGLLAVGNPAGGSADHASIDRGPPKDGNNASALCADLYRDRESLPGAEMETEAIAELFLSSTGEPVTVLCGREATEEAVKKRIPGHRIVHLATHGFFCDENKRRGFLLEDRLINPLLVSGLIMAPSGEDDGLLTAQELTCADLRDLDWVVLSACGSALGRLIMGEGLFGLRRAFEIAGARTVVMALWRIDDTATRELMEQIYRYRLSGSSTVDAVRRAQLERLHEQRRHLNRIHPALWGGIIAEGDWR